MANLQIKNVPEDLHEELRRRAKLRRMTVRDYVLELIERDQVRTSMQEWLAELASRPPRANIRPGQAAEWIREAREERERELDRRLGRFDDRRSAPEA